jgi:hypothetical protein
MRQKTFSSIGFEVHHKLTRREKFLAEMDAVVPCVPGHGCETVRCAGYAANLNSVAASNARAFCSALI